jgi:glycosyltransferase involved in cell wall biosynthesis
MPFELRHRALYAAFDRFPSPKGASTHIARFAGTMCETFGGGALALLGGEDLPVHARDEGIEIYRYPGPEPNMLDRALGYGRRLEMLLETPRETLELCHFRDPWSGVPIVRQCAGRAKLVYEVNGLPSIELPYRYRQISAATLTKIRRAEEYCLMHADAIITPSETIAANLVRLGAPGERIITIPNGADLLDPPSAPPDAPSRYILYFGALQRWQGIDTLLRAFARLGDLDDLGLVICASARERQSKLHRKLAARLGLGDRIIWRHSLRSEELVPWVANAALTVAPLSECSRNLDQGCAPLKILESMALGVPVIASDLPVTREILGDGIGGRLVRADRPSELARAIRLLLEQPDQLEALGASGRQRIEQGFTWDRSCETLREVYGEMVSDLRPDQASP